MMIEKTIEANIIAAVEALGLPGLVVRGAWQPAAVGKVKGEETESSAPAALAVAVAPRALEQFGFGICSMDVRLALAVRADLCPTGAAIETYAEPIADLLETWNATMDCDHDCGLAVAGRFQPGGLQMTGGEGPTFDRQLAIWSVTFSFSLRGVATLQDITQTTA